VADEAWRSVTAADLVIAELAQSEAALKARVAHLEEAIVDHVLDCETYRTLSQEAIHALAALTTKHRRLSDTVLALREEIRRYTRAQLSEAA